MTRTGPLLFAAFRPDDAYLIDIFEHGAWTREDVFKIIVAEWPDDGLVYELKGVECSQEPFTESERKGLRESGVNALIEIDGKAYMTARGLSSAGTSFHSLRMVGEVFRRARAFCDMLKENPTYVTDQIVAHNIAPPETIDLCFSFFDDGGYGFFEKNTRFGFRLVG
jgi:hypothetical protein